jgi:hypothetical protein
MSDNDEKCSQVCETGLSYCSSGKEAVAFLIGVIGLVAGSILASGIMVPVVTVSAIVMGGVGVWLGIRRYKRNKQKQLLEEQNARAQEQRSEQLVNMMNVIQRDIRDIKQLEQLQHAVLQPPQEEEEINADDLFVANPSSLKNKPHFFAIETKGEGELVMVEVLEGLSLFQNKVMR